MCKAIVRNVRKSTKIILIRHTDKRQTKSPNQTIDLGFLLGKEFISPFSVFLGVYRDRRPDPVAWIR